jgi:LPXTG-motif cell wall-anchored protein
MSEKENIRFTTAEKVILYTGILLFVLSFISEFNFHYFQGFMLELVDEDIFWRAEAAEVFNSMSFLIIGIALIIIAFKLSKKRRKKYSIINT